MGQNLVVQRPIPRMTNGVHSIRINQDRSGFIIATNRGIKTFWMDPLSVEHMLEVREVGSCKVAEWGGESNICALVGGGEKPIYPETVVKTVDMARKEVILETYSKSPVLGVRFVTEFIKQKLIVILHDQIRIQPLKKNLVCLQVLDTGPNPKGLCELSRNGIMVCPAPHRGQVQILDLNQIKVGTTATPIIINAHEGEIACLAISKSGNIIATASQKGTLLRIFNTVTKNKELELRRGCDTAIVYSISFSPCDQFVGVCSDKGTVHIFAVKDPSLNKTNMLNQMGNLLPSNLSKPFEGQKSLAQFSIPDECPSVLSFLDHQTIVAITLDGEYQKYLVTPQGQCKLKIKAHILDMGDDFPLPGVGPLKRGSPSKAKMEQENVGMEEEGGDNAKTNRGSEPAGKSEDSEKGKKSESAESSGGGVDAGHSKQTGSLRSEADEFCGKSERSGNTGSLRSEVNEYHGKSERSGNTASLRSEADEFCGKSERSGNTGSLRSEVNEYRGKSERSGNTASLRSEVNEYRGKSERSGNTGKGKGKENVGKTEASDNFGESEERVNAEMGKGGQTAGKIE